MPRASACIAVLAFFASPLSAQSSSDCAIDGIVVNAVTGEPIPRAHLAAMGKAGQSIVTADNAGRWRFTGLPCGQTQVIATRPGFIQASLGQPRVGLVFHPVTLNAGDPLHDVKIPLSPQSVVAGKVSDDQGDPLVNVTVTAMATKVVEGRRIFLGAGSANTNDLGEYRIAGLSGGKFIVCAHDNGSFPGSGTSGDSMVQERCFPGPVEAGAASAMAITGTTAQVDFTLARAPTVKIRGFFSGSPGRGATISLFKRLPNMSSRIGTVAIMGSDGSFEIRRVSPGSYVLSTDYFEAGKHLTARVPVEVGAADVDGVNVRLEPAFAVTGTVRIESKSTTIDPRQVNLLFRSADPTSGSGAVNWSQNRDSFTVNEVSPGSYHVEGFPNSPLFLKSAMLGGRDISKEEASITQAAGPIVVILSDDTGAIQGQTEDSDGKPVACWVMILPSGTRAFLQPRNIMSGPDGHFTVPNLAPGDYSLFAWDDWQQVEFANSDWMQRNASAVAATVEGAQTVSVKLRQRFVPVQ